MPKPTRFLVTGSSGFVGTKLKAALLRNFPGSDVFDLGGQGRIESQADIAEAVKRQPDMVFHLAARSSVGDSLSGAAATVQTNLMGTIYLAEAVRAQAPGATFVFAGSGEAYGATFVGKHDVVETDPLQPNTPYARSKAASEWAIKDILSDVCPVIALRLFNHTGAGQDERFVLPSFAHQIARIETGKHTPTIKVGNLAAERDFLHVDDVIDAYVALAKGHQTLGNGYDVYNIASGQPQRIEDLLTGLLALSSMKINVEIDPDRLRPSDIPRAVGNSTKFQQRWQWSPQRTIGSILQEVLAGARAQS